MFVRTRSHDSPILDTITQTRIQSDRDRDKENYFIE